MKKLIKIFMILIFCNPCFSMQQDHIPTLREIAFKQSVPKINQHIDIIIDRNTEILEKLKNIHDLIDLYCLPKKFIKEHAVINRLVEKCVANSYNKMQDDSDLKIKLWNSFDSIPHFRKKLQGQMGSIFLTQDQNCLPPLCIMPYAY